MYSLLLWRWKSNSQNNYHFTKRWDTQVKLTCFMAILLKVTEVCMSNFVHSCFGQLLCWHVDIALDLNTNYVRHAMFFSINDLSHSLEFAVPFWGGVPYRVLSFLTCGTIHSASLVLLLFHSCMPNEDRIWSVRCCLNV